MIKKHDAFERKRKFDSKVLEEFYDYLLSVCCLRELVCYDYCRRLVQILKEKEVKEKYGAFSLEDLAEGIVSVQELIVDYSKGGNLHDKNKTQHGAPSAALKKFKEFLSKKVPFNGTVLNWTSFPVKAPKADNDDVPYIEDHDYLEDEKVEDVYNDMQQLNDARVYLRETEGEMPFEIKVKHCSQIEIHNSDCTVIYKENGAVCNTVHKVISPKNYADLIRLMRRYHSILNNDHIPASIAVPFGGAHTYEYEFAGKSNYSRSHKLFDSRNKLLELQAYDEYNKIIANIIKE